MGEGLRQHRGHGGGVDAGLADGSSDRAHSRDRDERVTAFQGSFAADETLSARVFELLDVVFPGVGLQVVSARSRGFRWEDVSTPFVVTEGASVVAHVGLLELTMVLAGERMAVGVIHGVATHPAVRRRGHFRLAMEAALAAADTRYTTTILCTARPVLYESFGFRTVREHAFTIAAAAGCGHAALRHLDVNDPRDLARLHAILGARAPVSERVGVVDGRVVFAFNELARPLLYAEDLEVVVCCEHDGDTLRLFDVVGAKRCSLAAVLARIIEPVRRVAIYFTPDQLEVDARPEPTVFQDDPAAAGGAGDSVLMVRGPFAPEGIPFMLPRSARC